MPRVSRVIAVMTINAVLMVVAIVQYFAVAVVAFVVVVVHSSFQAVVVLRRLVHVDDAVDVTLGLAEKGCFFCHVTRTVTKMKTRYCNELVVRNNDNENARHSIYLHTTYCTLLLSHFVSKSM